MTLTADSQMEQMEPLKTTFLSRKGCVSAVVIDDQEARLNPAMVTNRVALHSQLPCLWMESMIIWNDCLSVANACSHATKKHL